MPMSVEEYKIAQPYMVARFSKERSSKGEGIEVIKNEPYENETGKGQFTHKVIHIGSSLPGWLKALLPTGSTELHEKAWNAYPYVKNVYTMPFFGEKFSISSQTRYFNDDGEQENALDLNPADLKARVVDTIDIVAENIDSRYYKKEEDPKLFKSVKTGRGPLAEGWRKTAQPRMTIYKVTSAEFKVWGLQTAVESWIQSFTRDTLLTGHRQAFTWIDEWYGMDMEAIRKMEADTKVQLDKIRAGNATPPKSPSPRASTDIAPGSDKQPSPRASAQDAPK